MQDRIFYGVCFGFVFGVFLRSLVFVNLYFTILLGIISFALFLFFLLISRSKWGIIASIFILAFCFGIFRFHIADRSAPFVFESQVSQKTSFAGKIIDGPDISENNQKLTIEMSRLNLDSKTEKIKILATTNFGEDFKYGDEINFTGKLEKPENFITDQGKEFDYVNYLRKDGIFYVMSYPSVEIISRGNGNFIKNALFFIKEKFLEKMNFAIQSPENLLMGGLILGEKASFSQELRQSFVNTGTIHIVALSGYNVTIVAEWFMKLLKIFSYSVSISAGIILIWLFVLMTGASSTAIRAGIMATFVLVHDVSFQLSFIATVAVIFLAPRVEKYFTWVTKSFELRDIVSVTCAVYIFVLPFILYKMGNLSLVALPANILILPFIPFTMLLGFLTGFIGLVWHVLAVPAGFISYLFLHYELGVISFFSHIPFASITFPNFPLFLATLIYAYFIYMLFGRSIKSFFN